MTLASSTAQGRIDPQLRKASMLLCILVPSAAASVRCSSHFCKISSSVNEIKSFTCSCLGYTAPQTADMLQQHALQAEAALPNRQKGFGVMHFANLLQQCQGHIRPQVADTWPVRTCTHAIYGFSGIENFGAHLDKCSDRALGWASEPAIHVAPSRHRARAGEALLANPALAQ